MYGANWTDGYINDNSWNSTWDNENQNWKRRKSGDVILKSLNNLKNITMEFTNEV